MGISDRRRRGHDISNAVDLPLANLILPMDMSGIPSRLVVGSVSDEIEDFQRQDILRSLHVGPYDLEQDSYRNSGAESVHLSPRMLESGASAARKAPQATTHSPHAVGDEQRYQNALAPSLTRDTQRHEKLQMTSQRASHSQRSYLTKWHKRKSQTTTRRKSSLGLLSMNNASRSHLRKFWLVYLVSVLAFVSFSLGIAAWVYEVSMASNLAAAQITWHRVEIDNMSPVSFGISLNGLLGNTGATAARFYSGQLNLVQNSTSFGSLTMPGFWTSKAGTLIDIRQTLDIANQGALNIWASTVATQSRPPLFFEGVLNAFKLFLIHVKFEHMQTELPTLKGCVIPLDPLPIAIAGQAGDATRRISAQLRLSSTSLYHIALPKVTFELLYQGNPCAQLSTPSAYLRPGELIWQMNGTLSNDCRSLQDKLDARAVETHVELRVLHVSLGDVELPYASALIQGWHWVVQLAI